MNYQFSPAAAPTRPGILNLAIITGLMLLGGCLLFAQPTQAQAGPSQTTAANDDQFIPENYEYSVVTGNNMTLLVRRSLQLFDQASSSLSLSEAQVIYAETNVAQDLGARDLIFPGESLSVDSTLIAKYASASQQLAPNTLAAWQVYADNADFDLSRIAAANVQTDDDGRLQPVNGDETDSAADDVTGPAPTDTEDETAADTDGSDAVWPWLFLGAGTLALLWYALWRKPEEI